MNIISVLNVFVGALALVAGGETDVGFNYVQEACSWTPNMSTGFREINLCFFFNFERGSLNECFRGETLLNQILNVIGAIGFVQM